MQNYAATVERIAAAARELEACEPTMATLIKQYDDTVGFGFVLNPTLARDVIADRGGRLAAQLKLARAVVAFVGVFRELREQSLAELCRQAAELERSPAE